MTADMDYQSYERALQFDKRISEIPFLQTLTHILVDELDPQDTDIVLDVGAGTGRLGMILSKLVSRGIIIGIDSGYGMLKVASEKIQRNSIENFFIVQGLAEALPLLSNSFNSASLVFSFHHFHDSEIALKEIFRVLDYNGQLVSLDPVLREARDETEERLNAIIEKAFQHAHGPDFRFFTAQDIRDLLENLGFSIKSYNTHNYPFYKKVVGQVPMGPHWLQAYELLLQQDEENLINKFNENYFVFELTKKGQFILTGEMTWVIVKAMKGKAD